MSVRLHVNGVERVVPAEATDPLLWVLRGDLGLASPKYGCGLEQCGACTVLIDDMPAMSCRVAVESVAGRKVTTLEGLADDPAARAVQDALLARNAAQCAYCIPGIVVTLRCLTERSGLDRDEVARALDGHLCRCGAQPRILAAALDALGIADG